MNAFSQRLLAMLTPGVRLLLALFTGVFLAAMVGRWLHIFDLYGWLALSGAKFWDGQVWRLVTYALLPFGILDFIMNCLALVVLGGRLERFWTRGELWLYCAVTAAGGGLAKVLLDPNGPVPLTGAAPMMFGLLAAWGFSRGGERLMVEPFGNLSVWQLVLLAGGISLLTVLLTAGLVIALAMLAGGLTGFFYLWLRHKWLMSRNSRVVHSERINRLEL